MRTFGWWVFALNACIWGSAAATAPAILVYSKTAGYRHDSIPVAIDAIQTMSESTTMFTPTFSEDENLFTPQSLSGYSAIVFLSNSDQVLTTDGEAALKSWLQGGGSLVGLHAATACLFEDESFGVGMGSWFDYHPDIQNATFTKVISHPTIDMLPDRYNYYEEVYNFRSDPRSVAAQVLLSVDASSYIDNMTGSRPYYQGTPHPIAWLRETTVDLNNGTGNGTALMPGRMWYTSLGHTNDTWRSPLHLAHVQAGLLWALEPFSLSSSNATSSVVPLSGTSSTTSSPTTLAPISSSTMPSSASTPSQGSTSPAVRPVISFNNVLLALLGLIACHL